MWYRPSFRYASGSRRSAAAIINKVLHQPITVLKQSQNGGAGENYIDAVRVLFDIEAPNPEGEMKSLDEQNTED
jgi:glutamyl-tRNA reductase